MSIQTPTTAIRHLGQLSFRPAPNIRQFMLFKVKGSTLVLALALLILVGIATHLTAFADTTSGNSTQTSSASSTLSRIPVTFDLTTAAVVTFVLVILGLVATLLLMTRLASPAQKTATE